MTFYNNDLKRYPVLSLTKEKQNRRFLFPTEEFEKCNLSRMRISWHIVSKSRSTLLHESCEGMFKYWFIGINVLPLALAAYSLKKIMRRPSLPSKPGSVYIKLILNAFLQALNLEGIC